ncbi:MAG: DUF554 domain-containing protein [Chloroflexi bacterium]|nr:DUF554 domain-containing protein [Chloroflexota bacterium]
MTGTLINTGTVLLGATIGAVVGPRFPARIRSLLLQTIGLVTIVIGLQGAIDTANVLVLLGSVVLGAVLGETLRIETAVQGLGAAVSRWMADRVPTDELRNADRDGSSISRGFVTASLIFCVGPLTILGSIQDGLTGAYETLAIKATLDGVMSAVLASTLGWGVIFAAGTVLVFQGTLTLGAGLAGELLTDEMIGEMTAVGGLLILGLGLNILQVTRISVENLLPALILAPALTALFGQRIG